MKTYLGFTLIEIVVSLCIIFILSAMILNGIYIYHNTHTTPSNVRKLTIENHNYYKTSEDMPIIHDPACTCKQNNTTPISNNDNFIFHDSWINFMNEINSDSQDFFDYTF